MEGLATHKSGAILRGVPLHQTSADPVSLSNMHACTVQLHQTCMLGSFIQLHVFVRCCYIRQGIWSVTNPSDMLTGRVSLPPIVKCVGYYPSSQLEYIRC